jgi:hypothetical protein
MVGKFSNVVLERSFYTRAYVFAPFFFRRETPKSNFSKIVFLKFRDFLDDIDVRTSVKKDLLCQK